MSGGVHHDVFYVLRTRCCESLLEEMKKNDMGDFGLSKALRRG